MNTGIESGPGLPRDVRSERRRARLTGRLIFGAVVATLGILWTLENLGLADADRVLRWWPVLLVVYGFVRVTGLDGCRRVVGGTLFMLAGGWMLAREVGWVQLSIFQLWPVLLIVLGLSLVWRSMRGPSLPGDAGDRSAYPRPFAFLGGVSRTVQSQELVGMEVTAVMGGVEVDLRGARARGPEVVLEVFAWWGGIELIVPEDWRVATEVTPIMGGVEDQTRVADGGGATTLVIRGLVVMGGVDIKNTKRDGDFRGVRVGVTSRSGRSRVKQVRVDPSGVTITREDDAPPPPTD